jgi:hypothetical protein
VDNLDEWDWERYLDDYPDLVDAGIYTIKGAKTHWLNHGLKEGRKRYKKNWFQNNAEFMQLREKKIVIAIMSCRKNRETRQRIIRDSWAKLLNDKLWFFFEGGETTLYNEQSNILTLDCPDTYQDLALKTKKMIEYVSASLDFDYLVKVDDDTCVIWNNLMSRYLPKRDYIGHAIGLKEYTNGIQYAQGGGYILSKRAVNIISEFDFEDGKDSVWWYGGQADTVKWIANDELKKTSSVEDLMVGDVLARRGVVISDIDAREKLFYSLETKGDMDNALGNFEIGRLGIFYHPVISEDLMHNLLAKKEKKVILIVTIGRTGSTLLRGILNTIDDSMIVGENFGLLQKLWESFECFSKTLMKSEDIDDTRAWYNPELSLDKFLDLLRQTAFSVLDANNAYRVIGLKEIRYDTDYISKADLRKYLNFIQFTIFNGAYIIFLTRDSEQVSQSRKRINFYPHRPEYNEIETVQSFFDYIENLAGYRRFFIDYSELTDGEKLKKLFKFIGENYNEELINEALSKKYSYPRGEE